VSGCPRRRENDLAGNSPLPSLSSLLEKTGCHGIILIEGGEIGMDKEDIEILRAMMGEVKEDI